MSLSLRIKPRKKYIHAQVEGEYEFGSALGIFEGILNACEDHRLNKALVDFSSMTGIPTLSERQRFSARFAEEHHDRISKNRIENCWFAFFGKKPQIDENRTGEMVAVSRNLMIKVTEDLDEAFEFLMVQREG